MSSFVSCGRPQVKIDRYGFHFQNRIQKVCRRDVSCGVAFMLKEKQPRSIIFTDEYSQFIRLTENPLSEEQMDFQSLPPMAKVQQAIQWEDKYDMPAVNLGNGQVALIVEDICQVDMALNLLKESMTDNLISIEFEWRSDPIFASKSKHQISLVTLGAQHLCVLFRVNKLNFEIPKQVFEFLQNQQLMIGLSNRYEQDEKRFEYSFGANFSESLGQNQGSCIDLTILFLIMGFKKLSFRQVAEHLLGAPRLIKNIKRSDWEAFELSKAQIYQAALDVFIQGGLLRELRRRYIAQEACPTCKKVYGVRLFQDKHLKCKDCGKEFLFMSGYLEHSLSKNHQTDLNLKNPVCETCERYNFVSEEDLYDFYQSTLIVGKNGSLE